MSITTLPALDRYDPAFKSQVEAFFATLLPQFTTNLNIEIARINAIASGTFSSTSTTSNVVGTGSKSFTVQTGKSYTLGQVIIIVDTANIANWMLGQVSSYNSGTGALVVSVSTIGGSGTKTAWTINVSAATAYAPPAVLAPTVVTTSSTITSPTDSRGAKLTLTGGGGGGGVSYGGSGAGACIATFSLSPGTSIVCVIGAGGLAANDGGNSSVTIGATVFAANGGKAGLANAVGGTSSGGDLNLQGNPTTNTSVGGGSIFGGGGIGVSPGTGVNPGGGGAGGSGGRAGFRGVAIFDWIT